MMTIRNHPQINRTAIVVAVCICMAASAPSSAGGLFQYEVGSQDVGLAAAGYAARAQDATTVFTNPAGMTRLDGQQIQLGTQVLNSNLKFSIGGGTDTRPAPLGLGADGSGYAVGSSGWFPGGGFFYSYSVSPDLKIGIASTGNFGLGLKYDDNWVGRYYVQQATLIGASLLPSIAYRVNEQFSVGLSVNAMYGYLKSVTGINNIPDARGDGKLVARDTKWGWGGNLGLLYEPSKGTRFGLTYSSQVKLNFAPQVQFTNTGPILTGLLNARGLQGATLDLGITVPQQVMGSVFYTVNDQWAVLGNVGWQQWSKFGYVEVSVSDTTNPTSLTTNLNFKDTWHVALGTQYRLSEPWHLNFGISYDSEFQSGPTVSPILPGNSTWRFGAGAQNQISKEFSWGIAGEYVYGGSLDVNKQSTLSPVLGGRGNLVGSYNNIGTFFVAANFNWKF
jgi:long-chain fatty acid transport protein